MLHFTEGYHTYYVYILTNWNKTVLYIGVTNNLKRRLSEHKEGITNGSKSFTARYHVCYLIYFERFTWIQEAIAREKELKGWKREKKMNLIMEQNPELNFLEL